MRLNSFLVLFFTHSPSFLAHTTGIELQAKSLSVLRVCSSERALALSLVDSHLKRLRPGSNLMVFCFKWSGLFHMYV